MGRHQFTGVLGAHARRRLFSSIFKSRAAEAGEVAEFDTHLPHWFGNADRHPVEYLSILGPQGERFHVKAGYRLHA